MSPRRRVECATCDRDADPSDPHGFCIMCAEEFRQILERNRWNCVRDGKLCNTIVSCCMYKRCLSDPNSVTNTARQLELLPTTQQE